MLNIFWLGIWNKDQWYLSTHNRTIWHLNRRKHHTGWFSKDAAFQCSYI